jgi:hypothetical protein
MSNTPFGDRRRDILAGVSQNRDERSAYFAKQPCHKPDISFADFVYPLMYTLLR